MQATLIKNQWVIDRRKKKPKVKAPLGDRERVPK